MKRLFVITLCIVAGFTTISLAQKKVTKAVYTHDFPSQMSEAVKNSYIKIFDKGKILYDINCAKCHNTIAGGIEVMPEFTKEHLAQYELRIQNPQHEESLSEMRVNAEELQQIMIFLTYYKKAGAEIKKK